MAGGGRLWWGMRRRPNDGGCLANHGRMLPVFWREEKGVDGRWLGGDSTGGRRGREACRRRDS